MLNSVLVDTYSRVDGREHHKHDQSAIAKRLKNEVHEASDFGNALGVSAELVKSRLDILLCPFDTVLYINLLASTSSEFILSRRQCNNRALPLDLS